MTGSYPLRILAFREEMIRWLPRAPNNRAYLEVLRAMPTQRLILAFLAEPRAVRF